MKVLLVNGSPKARGNTALALEEMVKVFEAEEIETEVLHVGNKDIRGCIACGNCGKLNLFLMHLTFLLMNQKLWQNRKMCL